MHGHSRHSSHTLQLLLEPTYLIGEVHSKLSRCYREARAVRVVVEVVFFLFSANLN